MTRKVQPGLVAACLCLFALTLPAATFPQSSRAVPVAQWYIGKFSGQVIDGDVRFRIAVTCESLTVCEYELQKQAPAPGRINRGRSASIQAVDVAIPNSNLLFTREAVRAQADAYAHKVDGALLRELRPLLESSAAFNACVGVPAAAGISWRLCKLDTQGPTLPAAALLISTMNPACQGQRFCAYYMFPLRPEGMI